MPDIAKRVQRALGKGAKADVVFALLSGSLTVEQLRRRSTFGKRAVVQALAALSQARMVMRRGEVYTLCGRDLWLDLMRRGRKA